MTRTPRIGLALAAALIAMTAMGHAQAPAVPGPSREALAAMWSDMWTAVILGDLTGARTFVYSRRRHLFFPDKSLNELQEVAHQMTHCRLTPVPLPFNDEAAQQRLRRQDPEKLEELYYRLECQHGDERVEGLVGMRRDVDGVWRFSSI
jgi:hypothetical protein